MKVLQDLRFFFREVRKKPGLALTAIISLALGIGATTAVFSVIYGLLANPFPYKGADRMIHLTVVNESGDDWWIGVTGPQLKLLRQAKCIESVAASWGTWNLTTTDEDLPQDVPSVQLTGNAGTHFGVPALLGRTLIPSDDPEGRDPEPVVVLSYLFWQRHFNSDRSVVGRRLQLVHKNYTIVGVLCPRSGAPVASDAQRRCWLVGPAPVGAGEASARSPTAVRSPLRSAPLHSWPSIAYRFDDAIQLLLPKQVHGRRKPRPGGANPGHQRGLLRDNGWRRGIRQLWHGLQNHPGRQSDDATPILLPKRVA